MIASIKVIHSVNHGFYFVAIVKRVAVRSIKFYRTVKQARKAATDWCNELKIQCEEE